MKDKDPTKKSGIQDSLNHSNKQGSLSPASDELQELSLSKGDSQGRLDPKKQSSLSQPDAFKGKKMIVPVITFALGLLVAMLIFRISSASFSNEAKDTSETIVSEVAEEEQTVTPDTIIYIPDSKLKKTIQEALGIENRDITMADALSLKSLTCSNKDGAYVYDLTGLSAFTNLKELTIYISEITDISQVSSLTSLTYLELNNSPITDITPLANLTNLTDLSLGCNQISDISPLSSLTNLTTLHLSGSQINDFSPLANLTALTKLTLVVCRFPDITPLAVLKNLTDLYLIDNQISDISPLTDLTNLTFLDLDNNQITDITPLVNMENLKTLILTDNQISDLSPLANLPNLTRLSILGNPVVENLSREEILDRLSGAENLQYLDYGAEPLKPVYPY